MNYKKIFYIDRSENYTICFLGHRLFEICDHYLMSFSLEEFPMSFSKDLLKMERITEDNLHYLQRAEFNYNTMKKYIIDKTEPVDGFMYFEQESNEPIGCIWVMFRGVTRLSTEFVTLMLLAFILMCFLNSEVIVISNTLFIRCSST